MSNKVRATTILCVRRGDKVALGGDGQVSLGNTIVKSGAKKIRKIYDGKVLAGFAGGAADGLTLLDHFEKSLQEYQGQLQRAAVEMARLWRTDKMLRRLEAMLVVANREHCLILSGNGDVLEPDYQIAAVGSGGNFAVASARALLEHSDLEADEIVRRSLKIAADICVYTNDQIVLETLDED